MKKIAITISLAVLFWFIMFSPWTAHLVNFWVTMLIATTVLITLSLLWGKEDLKELYTFKASHFVIGLISAFILYLVFYAGNFFSQLLFDFSKQQISNIYSTKSQANNVFIGFALLLWIGPAEEIFWRGFVQHKLSARYGGLKSFFITSVIYALVHIWSFNFMLIMAALICGLFWGWMFYKYKSVIPIIISHAVWDAFIFTVMPIN